MPKGIYKRPSIAERLLRKRKINPIMGCWEWQGARDSRGYGFIWWKGRQVGVHRVAAIVWGVMKNRKLQAMHRCDNPPCFNPAHLKQGTATDNMRDSVSKGRIATGERHGLVKLKRIREQLQTRRK
jgi:hypothetical protein